MTTNNGLINLNGALTQPGDEAIYTYNGTAGEQLYFDVLDTNSNIEFQLVSPTGYVIDSAYYYSYSAPITLTETGTYQIIVSSPYSTDNVGSYNLNILRLDNSPNLQFATTVTSSLSSGLAVNAYQFAGTKGQRIQFHSLLPVNYSAYWELYGTNNQLIGSAYLGQDFTVTLPNSGEYYLTIKGNYSSSTSIAYSFAANDVSDAPVSQSSSFFGVTQSGTLAANTTSSPITFAANAGQLIIINSQNQSSPITISIADPSNTVIYNGYAYYNSGAYVLPRSGNYTLTLTNNTSSAGSYNFQVLDIDTSSTAYTLGTEESGTLNSSLGMQIFSFTGAVGQNLYYDSLQNSSSNINVWCCINAGGAKKILVIVDALSNTLII